MCDPVLISLAVVAGGVKIATSLKAAQEQNEASQKNAQNHLAQYGDRLGSIRMQGVEQKRRLADEALDLNITNLKNLGILDSSLTFMGSGTAKSDAEYQSRQDIARVINYDLGHQRNVFSLQKNEEMSMAYLKTKSAISSLPTVSKTMQILTTASTIADTSLAAYSSYTALKAPGAGAGGAGGSKAAGSKGTKAANPFAEAETPISETFGLKSSVS